VPKPDSPPLGLHLCRLILRPMLGDLLRLVLPVPPGHPGSDLGQIRIPAFDHDNADLAPIFVGLAAFEGDVAIEHQIGQVLLRCLAKRLFRFRSINAGEPDLVPSPGVVENGDGVAVADADNPAFNGVG